MIVANVLLGINQGLAWSSTVIMKIDLVGPARRGKLMHGGQSRWRENALGRGQPAMPLGLNRKGAGQAGTAVVGPLPGG